MVAQLEEGHLVLEVGLDALQEQACELQKEQSESLMMVLTSKPIMR